MTVSISLSTCMTHSYMKDKYLGLMKRGLNDQHDTAKLLDAFFNDFRGQYPNLAETVKIIGGMEPSSSKLEREFTYEFLIYFLSVPNDSGPHFCNS